MQEPRVNAVTCASPAGVHRMAYREWGAADNARVLLCVHGLTRSSRDFDIFAAQMAPHYRVVCPDIVGRGLSDWLVDPAYYRIPQYVSDLLVLIARLQPAQLDWVGTSMGGLIGLGLAGALAAAEAVRVSRGADGLPPTQGLRLGRLVLNDVGPVIESSGLERIADYVDSDVRFGCFDEAQAWIQQVSASFGPHSDEQWAHLTRSCFVKRQGQWVRHHDLRLAEALRAENAATLAAAQQFMWTAYESLREPVLVVRGQQSDLLSANTVSQMAARNPRTHLLELPDVGHAPTLMSDDQVGPVSQFLLGL